MLSFMFCEGHSVVLKIDTREKGDGREVEVISVVRNDGGSDRSACSGRSEERSDLGYRV